MEFGTGLEPEPGVKFGTERERRRKGAVWRSVSYWWSFVVVLRSGFAHWVVALLGPLCCSGQAVKRTAGRRACGRLGSRGGPC